MRYLSAEYGIDNKMTHFVLQTHSLIKERHNFYVHSKTQYGPLSKEGYGMWEHYARYSSTLCMKNNSQINNS